MDIPKDEAHRGEAGKGTRLRVFNRELMLSCKLLVNDDPTGFDVGLNLQATCNRLVVIVGDRNFASFNIALDLEAASYRLAMVACNRNIASFNATLNLEAHCLVVIDGEPSGLDVTLNLQSLL